MSVVIPYGDMFNHKANPPTRWSYSDSDNGFILETYGDIKAGNEVYITYGRTKTNH